MFASATIRAAILQSWTKFHAMAEVLMISSKCKGFINPKDSMSLRIDVLGVGFHHLRWIGKGTTNLGHPHGAMRSLRSAMLRVKIVKPRREILRGGAVFAHEQWPFGLVFSVTDLPYCQADLGCVTNSVSDLLFAVKIPPWAFFWVLEAVVEIT